MKIVRGKKSVNKEKGGVVKVMTLQLIVAATVFCCFLGIKAVNAELYRSVSAGAFGDTGETSDRINDYIDKLAKDSKVFAVLFGVTDETDDENVSSVPEEETKSDASSEPESDNAEDNSSLDAAVSVFKMGEILYDVDLKLGQSGAEADDKALTVKIPDYSLVCCKLPEEPAKPLKTANLTDVFGLRINPVTGKQSFHNGIDLGGVKKGTEVFAVMSGTVKKASYDSVSGNYVILEHEDGFTSSYCHLNKRAVSTGDAVKKGDVVGYVGSTGQSTGPHLHLNIKKDGVYLNPLVYFDYRPYNAD